VEGCIIDSTMRTGLCLTAVAAVLAWLCLPAAAQTPLNERVLVVYNSNASGSLDVARYYMTERKTPPANRCKISVSSTHAIDRREFESRVKEPVRHCLEAAGVKKILYIVFSYQTPYVLTLGDRAFALDQFIGDIWDEYGGMRPGNELGNHPYFAD